MDTTKERVHVVSLCTGYGGIELGLRNLFPRMRTLAYCEVENYCVANLATKIETGQMDAAPICTSLAEFPFKCFRGVPNLIITGGFPCQPFSGASGKRRSTEDPRHLFPIILEGIRECRPSTVFLENVEGIISARTGDGESVLKYVLRSLEQVGYRATAGVFSASEVGATHQRKRVFILAIRRDLGDSEHLRSYEATSGRGTEETSKDCSKGENETRKLEGTSQPASGTDIQRRKQDHLANADGERLEGRISEGLCQRPVELSTWQRSPQVSRPNERQHEWESRRTIPKSRLGRTTNGSGIGMDSTAFRVDRLRLLGNGVYPDQAAKAYYYLNKRLCENDH